MLTKMDHNGMNSHAFKNRDPEWVTVKKAKKFKKCHECGSTMNGPDCLNKECSNYQPF